MPQKRDAMDFVAIDVETANADLASICQVGLVTVRGGKIADSWSSLVDPEDFFDFINVEIHGIDEHTVAGAPKFPDVYRGFTDRTAGLTVVSHTSFDRVAITGAANKYQLSASTRAWLDSARVARRAWPDKYRQRGYGLANIAADLGIEFKHHDAAEDARAAAEIILRASEVAGLDIEGWLNRVETPIDPHSTLPIRRDGNPDGPLYGEVLVFTGALDMARREASDLAAAIGCKVDSGVTKKTTLLVVGDQDARRLGGQDKSTKHRKAESLIEKGQPIRILRETDFNNLASLEIERSA